jgi:hypothetical protein
VHCCRSSGARRKSAVESRKTTIVLIVENLAEEDVDRNTLLDVVHRRK